MRCCASKTIIIIRFQQAPWKKTPFSSEHSITTYSVATDVASAFSFAFSLEQKRVEFSIKDISAHGEKSDIFFCSAVRRSASARYFRHLSFVCALVGSLNLNWLQLKYLSRRPHAFGYFQWWSSTKVQGYTTLLLCLSNDNITFSK